MDDNVRITKFGNKGEEVLYLDKLEGIYKDGLFATVKMDNIIELVPLNPEGRTHSSWTYSDELFIGFKDGTTVERLKELINMFLERNGIHK